MFVRGMIIAWFGAIVDIPAGFTICDGTLGTPDLRNLFIVGAGDNFAVDDRNIAPLHTHTFTGFSHDHNFTGDGHNHNHIAPLVIKQGNDFPGLISSDPAIGTTDGKIATGNNSGDVGLPPFHALAYIMKT